MSNNDDCWPWKHGVDEKGYGNTNLAGKHRKSHRVAYEIFNGGMLRSNENIKHTCGNRRCCNPKHLFVSENGNESHDWEKRFWSNIKISQPHRCWIWMGKSKTVFGYGMFREKWTPRIGRGKFRLSHIIAYRLIWGETNGLQVLHSCDNPSCCNPFHLALGTQMENIQDMIKKGRAKRLKGSQNPNAKIKESDVVKARKIAVPYSRTLGHSALARRLGISPANFNRIMNGKAWKHIQRNDVE